MKGIILAGGTATRLFPLTATTSKQLLPIYDRQMIFYPLNLLVKAGIKDILVIVAPEHSGQYLNLLGAIFEDQDINLEFKVQKIPRGLADAFIVGEDFIEGLTVYTNIEKLLKNGEAMFAKVYYTSLSPAYKQNYHHPSPSLYK